MAKTSSEILRAAGVNRETNAASNTRTTAPAPVSERSSAASSILQAAGVSRDTSKPLISTANAVSHAFTMATLPGTRADGKTLNTLGVQRLLRDTLAAGGSSDDWYKKLLEQSEEAAGARDSAYNAYRQAQTRQSAGRWDEMGNYLGEAPAADLDRLKKEWELADEAALWAAGLAKMGKDNRYMDLSGNEDFRQNAAAGLERFEREAAELNARQEADRQAEYERYMELGTGGMAYEQSQLQQLRDDTAWREPREDWTRQERETFGYLYNRDPEEAYAYAENLNNNKNAAKAYTEQQAAEGWATKNFGTGAAATGLSILGQATAGADFLDNLMEYAARGTITQRAQLSPADYGNIMSGAIAETLNADDSWGNRVLEKLSPVFGDVGVGDLYQVGYSALQSMTYAYLGGPVGGAAAYFGLGAKNGYEDAVLRGATPGQALTMGLASGLIESATEQLPIQNLLKMKSPSSVAGFFKSILQQSMIEGSEEAISQLGTTLADALVMGDKRDMQVTAERYMMQGMTREEAMKAAYKDWAKETAWSFMSGALSGGISGGVSSGTMALSKYRGDSGALIAEGLAAPEDSKAYEIAKRFADAAPEGRRTTGQLLAAGARATGRAAVNAGKAINSKVEAGFGPSAAYEKAQGLSRQSRGQSTTATQNAAEAAQEGQKGETDSHVANAPRNDSEEQIATTPAESRNDSVERNGSAKGKYWLRGHEAMALTEALNEQNRAQVKEIAKAQLEKAQNETPGKHLKSEGDIEALSDTMAKALLGEQIGVIEKANLKRNKQAVAVLDEMTRARDKAEFKGTAGGAVRSAFDDAALIEAMRKAEKGLPEYMRFFSKGEADSHVADAPRNDGGKRIAAAPAEPRNDSKGQALNTRGPEDETETVLDADMIEATMQSLGIERNVARSLVLSRKDVDPEVYALGIEEAFKAGAQGLPRSQVGKDPESYAAKLSVEQRGLAYKAGELFGGRATAKAQAEVRQAVKQSAGRKGPGKVRYRMDKKSLSARQKKSIKVLERVADALGVDFYIEPKGLSSNGWYDPRDSSIHISADAGPDFEGSLLFTAAHELTHFVQDWSPAKYKVLANFLFEQYEISGADLAQRMTKQIANARKDGRELTPEEAYDEVVADSMEKMLLDGRVLNQLEAINQQDASLFSKMMEYFRKLFKRISRLYKGLATNSEEARIVERMGADTVRQIQDYFTEGLADAGESYRAAGGTKNTTGDGGVRYQARDSKLNVVVDEKVTPQSVRKTLTDIYDGKYKKQSFTFPVLKHTPQVFMDYCHMDGDRSFVMQASKAYNAMRGDTKKQHNLGVDGMMDVIYGLYYPDYIILQNGGDNDGHYAAVVTINDGETVVAVDLGSWRPKEAAVNGEAGYYNVIITAFPNENDYIDRVLLAENNDVLYSKDEGKKYEIPEYVAGADSASGRTSDISKKTISQSRTNVKHQSQNPNAAQLEKENAVLREDVEKWKKLAKLADRVTNGKILDPTSVRPAATWLMEQTGAKGDRQGLAEELKSFYSKVLKMKDPTWETIEAQAGGPVAWLLQNLEDVPENTTEKAIYEQNLAITVYDSLWKVSTITTTADRYKAQIDKLNAEHKQKMSSAKQLIAELRGKLAEEREAHKAETAKIRREAEERYTQKRRELLRQVEEARQRNAANREISNLRRMISREAKQLDGLLNRGGKDRNVKEDMQSFVARALYYHSALFADNITAEEMIKTGFTVQVMPNEENLIATAREILQELDGVTPGSERERKLRGRLNYRIEKLQPLITRQREAMYKAHVDTILEELLKSYKELLNSDKQYIKDAYDANLAAYLEGMAEKMSGRTAVDMSVEELREVYDAFKAIHKAVLNTNKAFADGHDLRSDGAEAVQQLKAAGGSKKQRTSLQAAARRFGFGNMKPVYFFKLLGSKTLVKYFNNVLKAEGVWAQDVEEAKAHARKLMEEYKYNSWDMEKLYKFESTNGDEFELTVPQMLTLYALTRRGGQAIDHLRTGGFVFDPNSTRTAEGKLGIKKELNLDDATAYQLDYDTLVKIAGELSADQKAYAEKMVEYLSTALGSKGNEVSMAMYGIKLFKEERYFPLRVASQYMERIREAGSNERKIKNSGFTKPLKPNANNPVVLGDFTDIWSQHVNDMSMYHAFVLPMEDLYRVYNYKTRAEDNAAMESVNAAIQNAYGRPAAEYVDQLLKDINGGAIRDPRASLTTALVGKFKKSSTFASASVVIQQPSSVGRAFALIDPKYFTGRRMDNLAHYARWEEIKKYAPVAIIKEMGHFDTNMGRSTSDYIQQKEYKGLKERIKGIVTDEEYRDDILSRLPALADEITWCYIWEAVKRETAAKQPGLKNGSEEFLKAVGERFTEVIQETQVYDSVLSRSAYMRSKDSGMTMLTSFMAEPTTTMNMVLNAIVQGRRGDKAAARKGIGAALTSVIMNAALVSIVYAMRDDDEYESFLEKYLASFAVEIADGVNPFTYFPVIRDIWSAAQGYDIERADMSLITDLMDSINNTTKLLYQDTGSMSEKEQEAWLKKLKDALWKDADYLTALVNLPVKNIRRDIMAVGNTIGTLAADYKTSPEGLKNVVGESLVSAIPFLGQKPKDSKGDRIYSAIMAGDTEYADRLLASYATESAAASALRKALRDNEDRIVLAAAARLDGNTDEYLRIYEEILQEGNFDRDDIIKAIESEMNSMSDSGSTSTAASPDLIKPKDYYRAITAGDSEAIEAVVNAFTQQEKAKGKLPEDALSSLESGVTSTVRTDYMEDGLTRDEAKELLIKYGGKAEEDAEAYLKRLDFEKEYGFNWDDREEAYRRGEISTDDLTESYVVIKNISQEEAQAEIEVLNWQIEGLDYATIANIRAYKTYCAKYNVPKEIFLEIHKISNNTENDKDANGKSISYSAMKKIMALINSYDISAEQKTAIAQSLGWSEKNIRKYKLW